MTHSDLSPAAKRAIDLATKLLNIKGCTEAEAASRTAKAMDLLNAHNLDVAAIGSSASGNARKDETRKGGLYGWQRDLWAATAKLHFCVYFSIKGSERGSTYQHRVVGRHENVVIAELMADFLQGAVERIVQGHAKANGLNVFTRDMIAMREGMAARLVERLEAKRNEKVAAAEATRREEEVKKKHPGAATGTSVTILDVMHTEEDLNKDYLEGLEPGTHAKWRAEAEAAAREHRYHSDLWHNDREKLVALAEAGHAQAANRLKWWTRNEANAERDAAEELARRAAAGQREATMRANGTWKEPKQKTYTYREPAQSAADKRRGLDGYWIGRMKGDEVNLDDQINEEQRGRIG